MIMITISDLIVIISPALQNEVGDSFKKSRQHNYKRYGIGMIEIDNIAKRKILLDDVVNYLTKTEQQLRPRALESENDRLFVMGVMPRERVSKAGRPRRMVKE